MLGKNFVDKCLRAKILTDPWPHTVTENHLDEKEFSLLLNDCNRLLEIKLKDMPTHKTTTENHITPDQFTNFNINWYDQIFDISKNIYENRKELCDVFPKHRWADGLVVTAYIGVTPPKPYQHNIHQETETKIWSSVTYITPEKNCGTQMYTEGKKESLAKEAQWKPNSTMVFTGVVGKTWHSYHSTEESNRITLNFFIKNKEGVKEFFYP